MGQAHEINVEGPDGETARQRHFNQVDRVQQADVGQFAANQRGGEGRRVNRAIQPRPDIWHGADMVLVAMSQHQAQ